MAKISIPHEAFVFIGDGRKALFLRNEGDEKYLNLKTERVLFDQNPPSREQGSDQPGRAFASAITSWTEWVGSSALTAKIKGSLAIRTTGEKSFTGS